jgi:hypothetical protein
MWFLVCIDCRYQCYTGTISNNDAPPFCLTIVLCTVWTYNVRPARCKQSLADIVIDTHQVRIRSMLAVSNGWICIVSTNSDSLIVFTTCTSRFDPDMRCRSTKCCPHGQTILMYTILLPYGCTCVEYFHLAQLVVIYLVIIKQMST